MHYNVARLAKASVDEVITGDWTLRPVRPV